MRKEFKKIKLLFRGHGCILIFEYKYDCKIGSQGETFFILKINWMQCANKSILSLLILQWLQSAYIQNKYAS